jgi:uncharacterized membrane protein
MDLLTEGGVLAAVLIIVSVAKAIVPALQGRATVLTALVSGVALALIGYLTAAQGFAAVGLLSALFTGAQAGLAAVGLKIAGAAAVDRMPTR